MKRKKGIRCLVMTILVQLFGQAALGKSVGRRNIESVLFSCIHLFGQAR